MERLKDKADLASAQFRHPVLGEAGNIFTVKEELAAALEGQKADLILSDMAPNLSGIGAADAARSAHLWELALAFALEHLKPDGRFLTKAFQGSGYSQFVEQLKRHFARVQVRKPGASRQESAETYLLASEPKAGAAPPAGGGGGRDA